MLTAAERIAVMKRENDEARAILDGITLHPTDHEGQQMLAERVRMNKRLGDLIDKLETAFSDL